MSFTVPTASLPTVVTFTIGGTGATSSIGGGTVCCGAGCVNQYGSTSATNGGGGTWVGVSGSIFAVVGGMLAYVYLCTDIL